MSAVKSSWSACIVAALVLAKGAVAAPRDYDPPIPSPELRRSVRGKAEPLAPAPTSTRAQALGALQDDFDVTSYLLDLDFEPDGTTGKGTVSGSVTIAAQSLVDGLAHVVLDLRDGMTVSVVQRGAALLAFTHSADLVDVVLDQPFDAGESFEIKVSYSGKPQASGFGSIRWRKYSNSGFGQMVSTLSEPQGARDWWPCKDRPDDKAMVEEWWTVPGSWIATGNGISLGVQPVSGGKKRYKWKPSHPLATYLVSIAATDFILFGHTYTPIAGGSMPVVYYVYAEDGLEAQESFAPTVSMIEFFAETFGEYPFVEDKYGMSAFSQGGAMEHSTNTSYNYNLIDGGHTFDFVIAHELAHQWWGDSLSPRDFRNIWLNEGFATYSEALWYEHLHGPQGYQDYMNSLWSEFFGGPVYDNPQWFGNTVYDKGAWVQHMLRGVLGDPAFFQALRSWYADHKDGVVDTALYQANAEAAHGAPLAWFFDEWVYGENAPRYEYGWSSVDLGHGFRHYVGIKQVQTDASTFTMPVRLTLVTTSGSQAVTVWNDQVDQTFVFDTDDPLVDLIFDEQDFILKASLAQITLPDGDADGIPDGGDNCASTSNPGQLDTDGDGAGDACDADDDGDSLADGDDCAPTDPLQGTPGVVASLTVDRVSQALAHLAWTAAPRAESYDLTRGTLSALETAGDYGACLAPLVAGLGYDDADLPPAADGFVYLVRGHDAGCGGGGPLGEDSSGSPIPSPCP